MVNSASLFALQCPKCGGPVEYNKKKNEYVCSYCGISFRLMGGDNKNLQNRLELARDAMDKERYKEALRYYREALDYDSTSWEAKLGISSCEVIFSTPDEYNGQTFDWEIEDVKKQMLTMDPEEIKEAKLTLASHMMWVAVYCNNKYLDKLLKAWNKYYGNEMSTYDIDNWDDYDNDKSHRSQYAEEPEITTDQLLNDVERWLSEAAKLVLEAVPPEVKLDEHQLNIVEVFINYVRGYSAHITSRKYDSYMQDIERCESLLKVHDPDYKFKEKYNIVY